MIARHASADLVVYALIGERGGAVRGILEDQIGPQALGRACVIVSTSDQTPMLRVQSARAAAAIAEAARSEGQRVVLILDSLTRLSQALRDVAVAAGQHAAPDGFPASVLTDLSAFCERAGNDGKGSITCLFSLQLSPSNHRDEGLTHEVLAFIDAALRLSPSLIARNHTPPIDVLGSYSKAMPTVASPEHLDSARQVLELIADLERDADGSSLGPPKGQALPRVDPRQVYARSVEPFLRQPTDEGHDFAKTIANLRRLLN
jgi:flagellar biosynthesis/type III secretory pathway ATPase